MAYITYLDTDQVDESIRPTFQKIEGAFGSVPNLLRSMAHAPKLLDGFLSLYGAMKSGSLDPQLRELAYLKASESNRSRYCQAHHGRLALDLGVESGKIHDLPRFKSSDRFNEEEKKILEYSEQLTLNGRADPEVLVKLREFLSEEQVVELTLAVGLANLVNRFNDGLGIDIEEQC